MKPRSFLVAAILVSALVAAFQPAAVAAGPAPTTEVDQRVVFEIVGWIYDIDPGLLEAIARIESGGRADAISPKGAQGLMQLMPQTARRFDVRDPYNPVDSAIGAARFISSLRVQQAADIGAPDLPALLAAYNAGEGSVRRYHGIPPYAETRDYVRKVLWMYLMGSRPPGSLSPGGSRKSSTPRAVTDGGVLERLSSIRRARNAARKKGTNLQPVLP